MKKLIVVSGLILGGLSLAIPGSNLGAVLFIMGFACAIGAFVLAPLMFISNAIGEAIINSPIGDAIGNFGCSIIRLLLCNSMKDNRKRKLPLQKARPVRQKAGAN